MGLLFVICGCEDKHHSYTKSGATVNWGTHQIDSISYDLVASHDGVYLVEGYENPHRAPDRLLSSVQVEMKTGETKKICLNSKVYRIEVYWPDSKSIERKTVRLPENQGCN